MISSMSYSRSRRSRITSRCRRPKKPQRKPKPSAADVSISVLNDASFRDSFEIASRRSSNWALSTGNRPQNTTGCAGAKPGRASVQPFFSCVMVSPTRVSATCLIDAVRKPISPGFSASMGVICGVNTPIRSTGYVALVFIMRILSPFFSCPSMMRTKTTTPR